MTMLHRHSVGLNKKSLSKRLKRLFMLRLQDGSTILLSIISYVNSYGLKQKLKIA